MKALFKTCAVVPAASALLLAMPTELFAADSIVGSWYLEDPTAPEWNVVTFLADGSYYLASYLPTDSVHTGIEWGTYSWNPATGQVSASALGDLNGDYGVAGDVDGDLFAAVSGDLLTVSYPGCAPCRSDGTRVTTGSTTVVGGWLIDYGPGEREVLTLLNDGHYMLASVYDTDAAHTGIEWGSYTWDAAGGQLAGSAIFDGNGDWGLADSVGLSMSVSLDGMLASFSEGVDSFSATRIISAVPEPAVASMMLAGLGLLGVVASRRRPSSIP